MYFFRPFSLHKVSLNLSAKRCHDLLVGRQCYKMEFQIFGNTVKPGFSELREVLSLLLPRDTMTCLLEDNVTK